MKIQLQKVHAHTHNTNKKAAIGVQVLFNSMYSDTIHATRLQVMNNCFTLMTVTSEIQKNSFHKARRDAKM